MKQKIPNYLTWSRVWIIPVIAVLVVMPAGWTNYLSALLFCLVALTDWLDGYLARKWQVQSDFGAFLDPCLLYTSPSPRDQRGSRMPSSA